MTTTTCGKVRYNSSSQARAALQHIRKHGTFDSDKKPCAVYLCESGSTPHWHLTSQPR